MSSSQEDNRLIVKESGIQKHISFWDKRNKGYITPIDTITGFLTLGYNIIFSVALGTFTGIFLSVLSQTSWIPDPFCRSFVPNLIRSRKQTSGVYDEDGVFVPERFEQLFDKYAKKSNESITITEFVKMTKEQEELGGNIKAWVLGMIELCTAYFFIGHRGCLSKEDVRAAYDGTLFYRLKDNNSITQPARNPYTPLAGTYLLSSRKRGMRFIEDQVNTLFSTISITDSNVRDWVNYLQDVALSSLKRGSIIQGVSAPPPYRKTETVVIDEEPEEEEPRPYLTGVAQSDFVSNVPVSLLGGLGVANLYESNQEGSDLFQNLTKHEEEPQIHIASDEGDGEIMNRFLRHDDNDTLHQESLTGVKDGEEGKLIHIVSEKMQEFTTTDEEDSSMMHSTADEGSQHEEQHPVSESTAMTPPPDEEVPIVVPTEDNMETVKNKKKNKKAVDHPENQVLPVTEENKNEWPTPAKA
ncbi:hypothetical protein G6F46_006515 [Rhizopus delemar]|uniref:EF-hand domain-containing protein n=2 Tax=Rhizopus TaxID=4842 RepID=A0A9P7CP89_9FUNG|nr:hypothetical protein G6F55_005199 [Rhizopus delemar]KAG1543483.1 hypothetical protein G6F51_006646 [Rhizopus arrhizus]KAG1499967.1 hypothetical protein G6F54_004043 [Rhizopus delemar]KAG1513611.1 hypothetical protein G6F53_004303 [Rhizopus delemar]KAG1554659.1 hypothetical protein G6F49_007825 [Rhizopus delemar]